MAQLSANREPTMEEILASIRRIIESNDGASDGASADAAPPEADVDIQPEPAIGTTAGVAAPMPPVASVKEPRTSFAASAAMRQQAAARPVSLAEVAARVRASGMPTFSPAAAQPVLHSRGSAALRAEPEDVREEETEEAVCEFPASFPDDEADGADASEALFEVANDRTAKADRPAEPLRQPDPVFDADIREAVTAAMEREEPAPAAAKAEAPAAMPHAVAESPAPDQGRQLLSATSGAKVAAAFEDLTEAFQAPRRSFDEIAEEMLRPMLQEWLDDNLPTLVEKLVREEIERVARGNRR
ncbi:MAG: PopZ family protein [Pararhizobium sp.]